MPPEAGGTFEKPYFGLVNGLESYDYGALGSLSCATSGLQIAVYDDPENDGKFSWRCGSIDLLPFADDGGDGPIQPPICSIGAPTGTPAIFNLTSRLWECGTYNQILTLATREDISISCGIADFLMMYESVDQIRCVNPTDIDPSKTKTSRDVAELLAERVDVNNDKKWYVVMSDYDMTAQTARTWNFWRWTPFLNYDSTSGASLISSPPIGLPFASTLVAATFASFRVSSYTFVLAPPAANDVFTGVVTKLSATLAETPISNTLTFNSISATSGSVTFGFTGNANANCVAGETFVAGVTGKTWTAFTVSSDRHLIAVTLWIQTTESFTDFWALNFKK